MTDEAERAMQRFLPSQTSASGGTTALSGMDGQAVVAFSEMSSELLSKVELGLDSREARFKAITDKLMNRLDVIEALLQRQGVASRPGSGESSWKSSRKGRGLSVISKACSKVPGLETCVKEDQLHLVVPLTMWTMLVTAFSFAAKNGKSREWLGEAKFRQLACKTSVVTLGTGLQAILFSKQTGETMDKFATCGGKLWSYMVGNAIATLFHHAANYVYSMPDPDTGILVTKAPGGSAPVAPPWLQSLHPRERALEAIWLVFSRVESTGNRQSKKRKADTQEPLGEGAEMAVREMRSVYLDFLNYGRARARAYLFNNFMFLVDKIRSYDTLEEARVAGYEILFDDGDDGEEWMTEYADDVWNVENTSTGSMKRLRERRCPLEYTSGDSENLKLVSRLIERHPWLTITLKYKRKVLPPTRRDKRRSVGQDSSPGATNLPSEPFTAEEEIRLHRMALGFFMELFKKNDASFILCSSPYALKAVHAFAIGLRAAIRRELGLSVTSLEESALGNVTAFQPIIEGNEDEVKRALKASSQDDLTWLSIERKVSNEGQEQTTYERLCDGFFTICWRDFEAEMKKRELERQKKAAESSLSQSRAIEEGPGDMEETTYNDVDPCGF